MASGSGSETAFGLRLQLRDEFVGRQRGQGVRPQITPRHPHHPSAHRIPLEVTKGASRVRFIKDACEKSVLPVVATTTMEAVDVLHVEKMRTADSLREARLRLGDRDQEVWFVMRQYPG